ncbi:MAG: TAT-variant-translocated molybdopterin oxidoreductase [Myxococcota bacterium]
MKRAPYTYGQDLSGKQYWRSLDELAETPEFKEALEREFPDGASELLDPVTRRAFMNLMGATVGLAGLTACRRPEEKILPYSKRPEDVVEGMPLYYATAMPFAGTAIGLLVESHTGRPTKIEGNPRHADSLGAANVYAQSSVLDLYDPDRLTSSYEGKVSVENKRTAEQVKAALSARGTALKGKGGTGLAILTEAHRSPTLARQLDEVKKQLPGAKVYRWDAFSRDNVREGSRIAFGRPLDVSLALENAKVIVSVGSDFMHTEGSPVKNARAFASGRKLAEANAEMNRLYVVESHYTVTGSNADHRLRIPARDVPAFAMALARELATAHGVNLGDVTGAVDAYKPELVEKTGKWARAVAKDLAANRGTSALIAGDSLPPAVHAVVAAVNHALGNAGKTVNYVKAVDESSDGVASISALVQSLKAGEVDTLLILGGNPVFTAPADLDFAAAMDKAAVSIFHGLQENETAQKAKWVVHASHYLESWGDVRALDGTASVVQPLVAPLYASFTELDVLEGLLGGTRSSHELVRATWQAEKGGVDFEKNWRRALHDGLFAGTAYAPEAVEAKPADVAAAARALVVQKADGLEVTFHPDSHAWDGKYANNGWLQEMPDPMTKLTWDNAAFISKATADANGLRSGDVVTLSLKGGGSLTIPVLIAPGQADDSVALTVGQGRKVVGGVGKGVGFDAYGLRKTTGMSVVQGASLSKTGGRHDLAQTQTHHVMEGRPLVRETTLEKYRQTPNFAQTMVQHPPLLSLFDDFKYEGHKWGMVIDLTSCIGCNACMVACQAENNIPLVGKKGVLMSREMHWIRVDRYYEGDIGDPHAVFQPLPCQQCENAPCEQVCPVAATTHSSEGLNDMVYNRCIGTRYCANNCPYKVRRFNFFNYSTDNITNPKELGKGPEVNWSTTREMQFNPNVTVRARGVMEKCTYCVQRIQEAKIAAKREQQERVKDGAVVTACAQTCPTEAIIFGDLNDKGSRVAKHAASPRDYGILAELNTRPRTTYQAKIRNPNKELEQA